MGSPSALGALPFLSPLVRAVPEEWDGVAEDGPGACNANGGGVRAECSGVCVGVLRGRWDVEGRWVSWAVGMGVRGYPPFASASVSRNTDARGRRRPAHCQPNRPQTGRPELLLSFLPRHVPLTVEEMCLCSALHWACPCVFCMSVGGGSSCNARFSTARSRLGAPRDVISSSACVFWGRFTAGFQVFGQTCAVLPLRLSGTIASAQWRLAVNRRNLMGNRRTAGPRSRVPVGQRSLEVPRDGDQFCFVFSVQKRPAVGAFSLVPRAPPSPLHTQRRLTSDLPHVRLSPVTCSRTSIEPHAHPHRWWLLWRET